MFLAIKNEISNFLSPPRNLYKIFLLNLFGLQILRYVIKYIEFKFFNISKIDNYKSFISDSLNEHGYVVVENFLEAEEVQIVDNFIKKLNDKNYLIKKKYGEKNVLSFDMLAPHETDLDIEGKRIAKFFLEKIIRFNLDSVINKKINYLPSLSYENISVGNNFIDKGDLDSEFHADRFYPCIKAFYYLNDNNIENGAFQYIKTSHKFSFIRLVHEYIFSVISSVSFLKFLSKKIGYEFKNGRYTLLNSKIEKIYGKNSVVYCVGLKNSLVICNNKGFHKRGQFQANQTRLQLRMNFYDLQMPKWKLRLKNFIRKKVKRNKST
jgi:hypothetical protein